MNFINKMFDELKKETNNTLIEVSEAIQALEGHFGKELQSIRKK